jgi:hypothetical protein
MSGETNVGGVNVGGTFVGWTKVAPTLNPVLSIFFNIQANRSSLRDSYLNPSKSEGIITSY